MKKAGFAISLIGGVLAIIFSVLLIATGPYFSFGRDVSAFVSDNPGDAMLTMWRDIGKYNNVPMFWETDLADYMDEYGDILKKIDANDLKKIGNKYDMKSFDDLAAIYKDADAYIPTLRVSVIACLAASVLALAGAAAAKVARVPGGVMVLTGAGITLVFSLMAGSILPMALASLLLVIGGLMQLSRPKEEAVS